MLAADDLCLILPQRRRERSKIGAPVPLLFFFLGPFFRYRFVVVAECTSVRDGSGTIDAAIGRMWCYKTGRKNKETTTKI